MFKSNYSKKTIVELGGIPPEGMEHTDVICLKCNKNIKPKIIPIDITFRNQSNLTIVMGILAIIGSFGIWMMPFGSSGSGDGIFKFIYWIIAILFGIALISLGQRKVPDYDDFVDRIAEFVDKAIKDSNKLKEEND